MDSLYPSGSLQSDPFSPLLVQAMLRSGGSSNPGKPMARDTCPAVPSLSGISSSQSQSFSQSPSFSGDFSAGPCLHGQRRHASSRRETANRGVPHGMAPAGPLSVADLELLQLSMLEDLRVPPQLRSTPMIHSVGPLGYSPGASLRSLLLQDADQQPDAFGPSGLAEALLAQEMLLGGATGSQASAGRLSDGWEEKASLGVPPLACPSDAAASLLTNSTGSGAEGDGKSCAAGEQKRLKRLAANREAARRMRQRHSQRLAELEAQVAELRRANEDSEARLAAANAHVAHLERANAALEGRTAAVEGDAGAPTRAAAAVPSAVPETASGPASPQVVQRDSGANAAAVVSV